MESGRGGKGGAAALTRTVLLSDVKRLARRRYDSWDKVQASKQSSKDSTRQFMQVGRPVGVCAAAARQLRQAAACCAYCAACCAHCAACCAHCAAAAAGTTLAPSILPLPYILDGSGCAGTVVAALQRMEDKRKAREAELRAELATRGRSVAEIDEMANTRYWSSCTW